ncbi:MAG: hypothetical protein M3R17_07525 [Bacteroidota bacterium]|nr:hypothetical protein [Bacteroidota bacterium]
MRKLLFTLFVFAAGLQTISAQVPGYQGKRLSVGYNASSFFYLTDFSGGITDVIGSTRLSYKSEVAVNYTISRKVTMGFSYYRAKQEYIFKNGELENYGYFFPKKGVADCNLSIYELHFQFFRKNFVAPTGLYHQVSVGIVKYGLATADNKLTVYSGNGFSVDLDGPASPYTCAKLGYAIGKTNPIGHNFYINTTFGVNFFRGGDSPLFRNTSLNTQNYILANFNKGLRTHNLFEIKIGLGWLAF